MATRLEAFTEALPHADDEEFVSAPGLGVFKAKFIRRGLERGVIAEHSTGFGLCLVQPPEHGACGYCRGSKGSQPCEHCSCKLCTWFRQTEERSSPPVSRERWLQLLARVKAFTMSGPQPVMFTPALDDDVV